MRIRIWRTFGILLALSVLLGPSAAGSMQFDPLGQPVTVDAVVSLSSVSQGGTIDLAVRLKMKGHWHVNAHKINDEFLIPTEVRLTLPEGMSLQGIAYPDGVEKQLSFSESSMLLYEGETIIGARLAAAAEMPVGKYNIAAQVTYQACDNEKCLAPEEVTLTIPVRVSAPTEAVDATETDVFSKIDMETLMAGAGTITTGGRLGSIVDKYGMFVAFLAVFAWGLALNLTPCVFPMIPITVGYFGSQSKGKTSGTFLLAVLYVLGMATMYSALGLSAALTGSLLGTALQNPLVVMAVAAVLVLLSLSLFGVYEIRVPARLNNLAGASSGKGGGVGAFLMGLTVGIVAAPCIGPLVLALLTFVGESGSPLLGFSMFFVLALGLGFPFLFLALLSGNIQKLPKSGEWMEWVKKLFGIIMLAMAVYFLQPLLKPQLYFVLLGALFVVGGVLLGFILKTQTTALGFRVLRRFVGIAAPAFGLYLLLNPGHIIARNAPDDGIVWTAFDTALLEKAKTDGQYVIIDFSADWCLPCKELDRRTFNQQEVVDATAEFVNLKADLTKSASPPVAKLRKSFAIRGVPTVVFISPSGEERKDLRVFGFVDKDDFLARVERLKSGG